MTTSCGCGEMLPLQETVDIDIAHRPWYTFSNKMAEEKIPPTSQNDGAKHGDGLELPSRIEALLFVADEPIGIQQLAEALDAGEVEVEAGLEQLFSCYHTRGLRLQRKDNRVQFVTAPEAAADVERFLGLDVSSHLSAAALETLALIAYQQPITRMQMEAIRGVNCDGVLRTLLTRGLVAPQGRLEQAGRPIVYGTTFEFLQYFGLSSLRELPAFEEFQATLGGGGSGVAGCEANQTSPHDQV